MNNAIKNTYDKLIDIINSCGLPVGVAYFIIKDISNQLYIGYEEAINNEKNAEPIEETIEKEYDFSTEEKEEKENNNDSNIE